jgi:diaminobutyrate-2-oxoglutarate transaminase
VQAGCGRTGKFFSFEGMGIQPDLVVLSKSISGFRPADVAAAGATPRCDLWKPAEHNGTFRGNNHAFVTATTAIHKFWRDAPTFEGEVSERAERVRSVLLELAQRIPEARVKGRGMFQGLDVRDGALADRILRVCFVNGLVIEAAGPHDEVIKVMAPITTPLNLLDQGLDILRHAVSEVVKSEPLAAADWSQPWTGTSTRAEAWSQSLI